MFASSIDGILFEDKEIWFLEGIFDGLRLEFTLFSNLAVIPTEESMIEDYKFYILKVTLLLAGMIFDPFLIANDLF